MPCKPGLRPAIVEHSLWLTDEVLAEAWPRFLHVSSAHLQSGRRYGSNVPGPLEAHRRLSRRRMGISAVGAGMQGGGADFGPLFGLGGYGGRQFDPQRDLKWKPPGVEKVKKEEHWMFPKSAKRKVDIFESFAPAEEEVEDAVEESRAAFDDMLGQKKVEDMVAKDDLVDVLGFLQSTRDEPEANNTLRICEWMANRRVSKEAYQALADLIAHKTRLQTLQEEDMSGILASLMRFAKKDTTAIVQILNVMQHDKLQRVAESVTRTLARDSPSKSKPNPDLLEWLYCLRRSPSFRCVDIIDSWHRVHDVLASCFPNPAALVEHMQIFNTANLCRVLLEHWVPPMLTTPIAGPLTTVVGSEKLIRFSQKKSDLEAIRRSYAALQLAHSPTRRGRMRKWSCTINLLHALQQHGVPHRKLAKDIFAILTRNRGAPTLFYTFRELQRHPTLGVSQTLPIFLIRHFLDSKSRAGLAFASRVFRSSPTLPLTACPDLALRLARSEKVPADALWSILQRQTAEDIVPAAKRSHRQNCLRADHMHLVHLVALEIANSSAVRPRVAYRRVWECYRFLRHRGAPIKPMMASAMVTAGILRYLQQYKRPPLEMVRYILFVVEKVEGKSVAERLDRTIWVLWKEDVLPVVKDRWREQVKRARKGIDDVLQVMGGRRYRQYNLWEKCKRRTVSTSKGQRILAARKEWEATRLGLKHTPTSYIPFGRSQCQPLDPARRSKATISIPESAPAPVGESQSSTAAASFMKVSPIEDHCAESIQIIPRRTGLGYSRSVSVTAAEASKQQNSDE